MAAGFDTPYPIIYSRINIDPTFDIISMITIFSMMKSNKQDMRRRRWNTASLNELVIVDLVAALISVFSPLLAVIGLLFSGIVALIPLIALAILIFIIELIVGDGSVILDAFVVYVFVCLIVSIYLFEGFLIHEVLFTNGSDDEAPGVLRAGCRIGDGILGLLWWLTIPLVVLSILTVDIWTNVAILDLEVFKMVLSVYFALLLLTRLHGLYYRLHGKLSTNLSIIACYCIAAGSIEAVSYVVAGGSPVTEFIFEADPSDSVQNNELGMGTLYIPLLGIVEILDLAGFNAVSGVNELLAEAVLFNIASGEGFIFSLFVAFIALPAIIYSSALAYSIRYRVWNTTLLIFSKLVGIATWLVVSIQALVVDSLKLSLSIVLSVVLLRPRE